MPNTLTLAIVQAELAADIKDNHAKLTAFIEEAAGQGTQLIVLPELFSGPYFCKTQDDAHFARAYPVLEHPAFKAMQPLARALNIAIPVSLFEKDGPHYYNSVVMLDAGGEVLGLYRKSHIPDGPGYQEKFYFRPGDTGYKVFKTRFARIGVGICWDQWFPEAARAMALKGAECLVYPTAIGAEPQDPSLDTAARWRRAMQGHAVCNTIPVAASNRIGNENGQRFYGTSFIADETGECVAQFGREDEGVRIARFDLDAIERERAAWGFFRDRRADLMTL